MIYKEGPPAIDPLNPWSDDTFSRQSEGLILSRLIAQSSPGPITISLQSPWGSGKTVFLARVAAELINTHRVETICIDAWKSDHHGDPLVPILATLTERMDAIRVDPSLGAKARAKLDKAMTNVAEIGVKFVLPVAGLVANVVAPGSGILASEGAKIGERALKEQRDRAKAEPIFRDALIDARDVISRRPNRGPIRPILIIVDELDRCRPDYAILMLERIKHYFDIPGILFLISTDHGNLPSAVQTVYGSHVNGEEYLRKFFDYEFHLAPASHAALAKHLIDRRYPAEVPTYSVFGLATAGTHPSRAPSAEEFDKGEYTQYFGDLSSAFQLSARDQVQAFTMLTAYLTTLKKPSVSIPLIDCFLVCLRFGAPEVFRDVVKSGSVGIPTEFNQGQNKLLSGLSRNHYAEILRAFLSSHGPDVLLTKIAVEVRETLLSRHSGGRRSDQANNIIELTLRRLSKSEKLTPRQYTFNVVRLTQAFLRPVEHDDEADEG